MFHRQQAPRYERALAGLGDVYSQLGESRDAVKYVERVLKNRPSDATPYFDLAVLFQQRGQDEVALPFYRKVLELKPGDPDTIGNVSKLHLGR